MQVGTCTNHTEQTSMTISGTLEHGIVLKMYVICFAKPSRC